jgi:hypothetical protein
MDNEQAIYSEKAKRLVLLAKVPPPRWGYLFLFVRYLGSDVTPIGFSSGRLFGGKHCVTQ